MFILRERFYVYIYIYTFIRKFIYTNKATKILDLSDQTSCRNLKTFIT